MIDRLRDGEQTSLERLNEVVDGTNAAGVDRAGAGLSSTGSIINLSSSISLLSSVIVCQVVNSGFVVLNPYDVAVVTGSMRDEDDPMLEDEVILEVREPQSSDDNDLHFVIVREPLIVDGIGKAIVMGVCHAWVRGDDFENYAHVDYDEVTDPILQLTSDETICRILWQDESGAATSAHLAIVVLGVGSGGGEAIDPCPFFVDDGKAYYYTSGVFGIGDYELLSHFEP